jgi:tetratricopeptide (TPR) repeat protein
MRTALRLALAVLPAAASAQGFALDLPLLSQRATVSQTIGLTDISITYHRPLVKQRVIWDSLVPYGKVWRSGANINTTIAFSDPVTINGQSLDRGTYGLHTIPGRDRWTIIFSKNSTSWGSFTYHEGEDALRVTVQPQASPMHEALTYEFAAIGPDSTVVALEWEKLAVPFTVRVDVHRVVIASLQRQLRTLQRYSWLGWNEAATYLLTEKIELDTALAYTDQSIQNEDRFDNELTKSKILIVLSRPDDATKAQNRALALGTPAQLDQFARDLVAQKRDSAAWSVFRMNATRHPEQWFVHDGLARVYSAQHKFDEARKEMTIALANAPPAEKNRLDGLLKQLVAKQDISQAP